MFKNGNKKSTYLAIGADEKTAWATHEHNHTRKGVFHVERLVFLYLIIANKAFHCKDCSKERTELYT